MNLSMRSRAQALLIAAMFRLASATTPSSPYVTFEWIAGYKPATLVTDFAAIDLDQKIMEQSLDQRRLDAARYVYEKGGNSKSVAKLTLHNLGMPTLNPIPAGTEVLGWSEDGKPIRGILLRPLSWLFEDESVDIVVQYQVHVAQEDHGRCHVGGLIAENEATQSGCFEETGTVQLFDFQHGGPGHKFNYTYDILRGNYNEHSIRRFSSHAIQEMEECEKCPFPVFQKFFEYYGTPVYADRWVRSLFEDTSTKFKNGNAVQRGFSEFARIGGIKEATKVLNMWMYVIHLMEDSITQCEVPCIDEDCEFVHVHQWDKAVALYVGSMQGESGAGNGNLLFSLADKMCARFRTCGANSQFEMGTSAVNLQIIHEFTRGQGMVGRRECHTARLVKDRIVELMTVPLVQSNLDAAYTRNYYPAATKQYSHRDHVKSAVYAASILPILHKCSPEDAEIVYDNLGLGEASKTDNHVDFRSIKEAFERNYNCMGIKCSDVGGVWDRGSYGHYAFPCDLPKTNGLKEGNGLMSFVVGTFVCTLVILVAIFALGYKGRRRKVPRLINVVPSPQFIPNPSSHGFD